MRRFFESRPGYDAALFAENEPFALFERWLKEAKDKEPNDPNGMAHDKKRRQGRPRWILPRRIGEVEIVDDVPAEVVRAVLEETRANAAE